ncbi:redox-sensing transcriptional repressor Rex [Chrysiogenes arsenatis]|uniref:redox-sensing transcriptional repressor Rex n=1 Tax=Chrysiogenes arsenatis TaxID=309797 RepID=UPI00041B4C5E|nr:redox-sensing transcriptional repressor Rex [Chrysiogenes arsenatis]
MKIPEATIRRLSIYMRLLDSLELQGTEVVSSDILETLCGFKSAQIRKDLAYFGEMGVRGVGYYVTDLKLQIQQILGVKGSWNVVLVGAGNLGHALITYQGFRKSGFNITVVYDKDPAKLRDLPSTIVGVTTEADLEKAIKDHKVNVAIMTVTSEAAQQVANHLVSCGINGLLNFTPVRLKLPDTVKVKYVDFSVELEGLAFYLSKNPHLQANE